MLLWEKGWNKMYHCNGCNLDFKDNIGLSNHNRIHNSILGYNKNCLQCKKEFIPTSTKNNFCSVGCGYLYRYYNYYKNKLDERSCKFCNSIFQPIEGKQKFCSINCRNKNAYKKHYKSYGNPKKEILCSFCNQTFLHRDERNKFCSKKCCRSFNYIKNKDKIDKRRKEYQKTPKMREYYKEYSRKYYWDNLEIQRENCRKRAFKRMHNIKENKPEKYLEIRIKDRIGRKKRWEKWKLQENGRRENLGLPSVGQGFKKEMELLFYISYLFRGYEIVQHDRKALNGLEIDIYIPSLKLGFEYMGKQHFIKNDKWFLANGDSFEMRLFRDKRKREIAKEKGITIIDINYNEILSEQLILDKLKDYNIETIQGRIK